MDHLTGEQRSALMSKIRRSGTKPELRVRKLVYGLGYRYRLNVKGLPGSPDLVFRNRKKVIFVHGCFWHGHGCGRPSPPKERAEFWDQKITRNRMRDAATADELLANGWDVIAIWECELKVRDTDELIHRLREFLGR